MKDEDKYLFISKKYSYLKIQIIGIITIDVFFCAPMIWASGSISGKFIYLVSLPLPITLILIYYMLISHWERLYIENDVIHIKSKSTFIPLHKMANLSDVVELVFVYGGLIETKNPSRDELKELKMIMGERISANIASRNILTPPDVRLSKDLIFHAYPEKIIIKTREGNKYSYSSLTSTGEYKRFAACFPQSVLLSWQYGLILI